MNPERKLKTIRLGICVLIAFTVLASGGVEWWGVGVLEIGAATLLFAWGILAIRRQRVEIHWNWLYLPLLGITALVAIQRIFGLSVYAYATETELLKGLAYIILCCLAAESFRTAKDRNLLAWFLITLSFAVSVFGIVQTFAFNGKLFWQFSLPDGAEPFGPFVNRDHFAGFVELTAPLGLAMLFNKAHRPDKTALLILCTFMPIVALLLSGSRGGIVGFTVATLVLVVFSRQRLAERKFVLATLALVVMAGTISLWLGAGAAAARFETISPAGLTNSQRIAMDRDTWKIFLDHPLMGTGLGTLETVYPKYQSFYGKKIVGHAHNDYLELLAETGALGGVLRAGFIAVFLWTGIQNARSAESATNRAFLAGSLGACSGLLVHSLVDFNLHIPSNALIFLLLATLSCARIDARVEPSEEEKT